MNDLLNYVKARLDDNVGRLQDVARCTGLSYDTVLRIKNGEGDPGYSKIRLLGDFFGYRCDDGQHDCNNAPQ